ncbi:MAG: hypothetical protein QXS68_08395, partial [Candidatus Methanomethylicaceae archaeon]
PFKADPEKKRTVAHPVVVAIRQRLTYGVRPATQEVLAKLTPKFVAVQDQKCSVYMVKWERLCACPAGSDLLPSAFFPVASFVWCCYN